MNRRTKSSVEPEPAPEPAPEPDRSLTGGPCYICKKSLITTLATSELMTKSNIRCTREEKVHKDFIAKFLAKEMQSRTPEDMALVNRAVPVEPRAEVIAVSCGHLFHRRCFREYSEKYKAVKRCQLVECPLCRQTVLMATVVTVDTRPMDCGQDRLPVPICKQVKTLQKEGMEMLENIRTTRKNNGRGLLFYMEQMFRLKNFKREIVEYYHPFWMNDKNVEKLRGRRDALKMEINERELDNLNQAILFLNKLESDHRLTRVAVLCLRRLRTCREGIDSFRRLVQSLQKFHIDKTTGDLDVPGMTTHLVQIICAGFKFPSETVQQSWPNHSKKKWGF